jgi:hypothetical protein
MDAFCIACDSWVPVVHQEPDGRGQIDRVFECGHENRVEEPDLSVVVDDADGRI